MLLCRQLSGVHIHAQARTLMELVRAFYSDPAAHQWVYRFNHQQEAFSFEELLRQLGHKSAPAGSSGGAAPQQ